MLAQCDSHGGLRHLPHLRTVLAVYRTGSFGRAAGTLGVSQPTVTNHVRALEDFFGFSLFERNADGVTPTSVAHTIITQVAGPLDQLDRVITGAHRNSACPIRLGGPREFMTQLVIPALAALDTTLPRIDVVLGDSRPLLGRLEAGALDIVVADVRPSRSALRSWPLAAERLILVAAPGIVAPGAPLSVLDEIPMIAYDESMATMRHFWNTVFGNEPRFAPALTLPDLQAARAAALSGLGTTVLPDYLVRDDLRRGALVALAEGGAAPAETYFMAVGAMATQNRPGTDLLAEALTEAITSRPG